MLDRVKICTALIFLIFICTPIITHGLEAGTGAGMIRIDKNTYHLERHDMTYVNIDGQSYLEKRQEVTITVTYPNEHTEIRRVQSTDDGIFKDILILDKDSHPGTYYITGKGENGILGRIDFRVIPLRDPPVVERQVPQLILPNLIINTDKQSYSEGDTIIINGAVTGSSLYSAGLKIFSPSKQIHAEQIIVNMDGTFSTSIKTTGSAWSQSGEYTIDIGYADRAEKITFSFVSTSQNTSHQQIQKNNNIGKIWDDASEFYYMHEQIINLIIIVFVIGVGIYAAKKYWPSKSNQTKNTGWASPTNHASDSLFGGKSRSTTSTDSNMAGTSSEPAKKDPVIPRVIPKGTRQKTRSKIITETPDATSIFTNKASDDGQKPNILRQTPSTVRQVSPPSDSKTSTQEHDSSWNPPIIVIDTNILYDYAGIKLDSDGGFLRPTESDKRHYKRIQKYLDEKMNKKILYVPIIVFREFSSKTKTIKDDIDRLKLVIKISTISNYVGMDKDIYDLHNDKNYHKIPGNSELPKWDTDLDIAVKPIYKFYKDIHYSEEPEDKEMRERWEARKRKHDPTASLIKKTPAMERDRKILATAIQLKNINYGRKIELLSRDGDFTIFKSLIIAKFKIRIIDGYH